MDDHRTLWLGRAWDPLESTLRWIQTWTTGRSPVPEDTAEEILDPWQGPMDAIAVEGATRTGWTMPLERLVLRPPVRPSKIIGVGRNYPAHAAEMGSEPPTEPLLFFKPPSALVTNGAAIVLPRGYERIDMEAELVVVIGSGGRHLGEANALDAVIGYTIGNDVSCRDLQRQEPQWARAKGFDTFSPVGAWVRVSPPGIPLPSNARIRGYHDGVLRQDESIAGMVFSVARIVSYVSSCMTLVPGDLVYTGTPEGVTALVPGSQVCVEMDGFDLGRLENPVVSAD